MDQIGAYKQMHFLFFPHQGIVGVGGVLGRAEVQNKSVNFNHLVTPFF